MDSPTPETVRAALAGFDERHQKIVAGLLFVMMRAPERVREREWMAEQLTRVTLLAGELEADTPADGVAVMQAFLRAHATELLDAALLLFQRVALDLAPRAAAGFTVEDALCVGLAYLPPAETAPTPETAVREEARLRDLGEQPLARLMAAHGIAPHDLVAASSEQLTHKMVTHAMKGRRLTPNAMRKVERAWRKVAPETVRESALFDYA
jgi:hypothetical protein